MALELNKTTSINVGVIVNNAVAAVRSVQGQENARRESEFQKAVADGMTYEEQLKFRKEQLDKAKSGNFVDSQYVSDLEDAISNTKKLVRYERIRNQYKDALNDYSTGKSSISSYINLLEEQLEDEKDETLRTEIRTLLDSARVEQRTNELNAVKNRALVAQKDNSLSLIEKSITEVQNKRSRASIAENEDEVAMWDDTLISLRTAKARVQIEDSINEITFKINKNNPKANDKLGYLNDEIAGADSRDEITYNGVTYPSLRAFWEDKRNEYISNSYFDEVSTEIANETSRIAAQSKFGQIPVTRIQAVDNYYTQLKTRSEFAPFLDVIEQRRVDALSTMTTDLAESLYTEASVSGDTTKAQNAILNLENRFGISLSREPFAGEGTIADTTTTPRTVVTTPTPSVDTPVAGGGRTYQTVEGDSLSRIAAQNNVSLLQLLDANPEYRANPSQVAIGATLNIPESQAETVPTPSRVEPTPEPTQVTPPAPQPTPTRETETIQAKVYNVVRGDSLSRIASQNNTTVEELARLNNIEDVNKIQVGQQLKLQ